MPLISQLAEQEITRLWDQGLKPTLAEIVLLNNLGLRIQEIARSSGRLSMGVRCGNVTLYPWTLASACWYSSVACEIFTEDDMLEWCCVFALSNGPQPEAFEDAQDYEGARQVITAWAFRCSATRGDLVHVASAVAPEIFWPFRPQPPGAGGRLLTTEERVGHLTCATGLPRAYWLASPRDHVRSVEEYMTIQQGGDIKPGDRGQDATGEFQSVLHQVKQRLLAGQETANG